MQQITVMTRPERRRRWSDEERLQILAERTLQVHFYRDFLTNDHADRLEIASAPTFAHDALVPPARS